jgi:uroporphyrin-III C-methyltransferase
MNEKKSSGKVYLVGAGPGDPGLLTIKALKILNSCDVIIYDALMNPDILKYASSKAEKIFIGPSRQKSRIDQAKVKQIMIQKASDGLSVVRLKGGDPFMFGRGGEEAEVLTEAGIKWEIVPGISSGIAVPAYAAIPLTHRECASSVTFITGHESLNKSRIDWDKIRYAFNTLVIFMGVTKIKEIISQLLKSNYEVTTPIAVIESGTTPNQRVRTGTLGDIIERVTDEPIRTPALIVIGDVVKYRDKLVKYLSQNNFDGDSLNKEIIELID